MPIMADVSIISKSNYCLGFPTVLVIQPISASIVMCVCACVRTCTRALLYTRSGDVD